MSSSDPFGFDISVSASKKGKPRTRSRGVMSGETEASTRTCEHPGCSEPGKFRAPKSPDILDEFLWFCQKHVREYNAKWNFFHGTSEEELEAQVSGSARRGASKSLGSDQERAWNRLGFGGSKASEAGAAKGAARAYQGKRKLPPNERQAIDILDAKDFWSKADIRKAYKALIKILHPDLNGGNRSHEEQLQNVVWAWAQIKDSRNFR